MKKILILLLIISIFVLTSCSSQVSDQNVNKGKEGTKPILKIYCMDYNYPLENSITYFNSSGNKVSIVATEFKDTGEYNNKLTTEILAGEGPDIYVDYNIFKSIRKAVSSGVFCDLNELIADDKSFDISKYNKKIMDDSIINGKRYFFPIEYNCSGFYTTKELLSKNNISVDDSKWTWKEFGKIAKSFAAKNKGKDKYLLGLGFGFRTIMSNCGMSFIDYSNGKSKFNCPEFVELLQAYKDMYPALCPENVITKNPNKFAHLDKGTIVLLYDDVVPSVTYANNSVIEGKLNSETVLLSLPTYKSGCSTLTRLGRFAAINSNCKYKEQAFKFLKLLLSKECRHRKTDVGIPLDNSIFKDELNTYLTSDVNRLEKLNYGNYEAEPINITKALFNKTNEIAGKIQGMQIVDKAVYTIIDHELPDLLNGKKSAQQVAEKINEKVTVFLNE